MILQAKYDSLQEGVDKASVYCACPQVPDSVEFFKENSAAAAEMVAYTTRLAKYAERVAPRSQIKMRFAEFVVDYVRGMHELVRRRWH